MVKLKSRLLMMSSLAFIFCCGYLQMASAQFGGGNGPWYRYVDDSQSMTITWTAPSNGSVTFDTIGSGFDTKLTASHNGARITSDDDGVGDATGSSIVSFGVAANTTYTITLSSVNGSYGNAVLNCHFTPDVTATPTPKPTAASAPAKIKISGRVTNSVTGAGVANVSVAAETSGGYHSVVTNTDGTYVIDNLTRDPYTVKASSSRTVGTYTFEPPIAYVDFRTSPAEVVVNFKAVPPAPTATPVPTATLTPVPTATPTPRPTATPVPSQRDSKAFLQAYADGTEGSNTPPKTNKFSAKGKTWIELGITVGAHETVSLESAVVFLEFAGGFGPLKYHIPLNKRTGWTKLINGKRVPAPEAPTTTNDSNQAVSYFYRFAWDATGKTGTYTVTSKDFFYKQAEQVHFFLQVVHLMKAAPIRFPSKPTKSRQLQVQVPNLPPRHLPNLPPRHLPNLPPRHLPNLRLHHLPSRQSSHPQRLRPSRQPRPTR